ncbi:MAG: hypothetical protein RR146_08390 [Lachnospiraceae bacterium]
MDKIGLISTNLAEKIALTVTESPYHITAETISNTCGRNTQRSKSTKERRKRNPYADRFNHHMPLFDAMQTASRKAFKRVFGY